jgi:methylmalonyl-CoA/ethylmalonyl-CoA epimerase
MSTDFQRLHHIGFIVQSIEASMPGFLQSMSGTWDGKVFHDPIQRVNVAFLSTPGTDVQIELVEPAAERNPVAAFLANGGGIHHICYEVEDCDAALALMRERKALVVNRPRPAVAFDGRRVAWILTAEKLLVEFVETRTPAAGNIMKR